MFSVHVLDELRACAHRRSIEEGIRLLAKAHVNLAALTPSDPRAASAISCLALWIDLGYRDNGLFDTLLARFEAATRHSLPLVDYLHLRLAEAFAAMRAEELPCALRHLETVLALAGEAADAELRMVATLWKARCLRKAGEYGQALDVVRAGMELAAEASLRPLKAVMQTLESWIVFQNGDSPEAIRILQEAEPVLRETDDFITLGNIQSAYGRIALREGRYDHAMNYFEASVELFQRRASLTGYLARSLTNMAQAKRFLALQLRRRMDETLAQNRRPGAAPETAGPQQKAAQRERMYALLASAQADLRQADLIYKDMQNHHGAGNADVGLAQIHLDLGSLDQAELRANEAFDLGSSKADFLLMCRARMLQAAVANARYEDEVGEHDDPSRFAQLAHDCSKEAVAYGERTQNRRLLAQAHLTHGLSLVNGFFDEPDAARVCCDRAEACLGQDKRDALWGEIATLRGRLWRTGVEDPNLRAWSQGVVNGKTLGQVVLQFEELLIRKVWEHESRKVSRVAQRLSVSPKKVRRVLRHLGVL